ncbi:hypothetical protein FRD01_14695 [Microvenator marinus]|uniref:Uncharacterized protein n=1 Tax=Microvenator marinus TaxID=2600177 RepID=A0A5B8XS20_9DELT|nr:hypothetical protein [Microvenator marinus]QED28460.1 hypothetical protein FRD01_14695 [Microvenator marinus]
MRTLAYIKSEIERVENGERLVVCNPTNANEDLSERWETNRDAYDAFCSGIHEFHDRWARVLRKTQTEAVEELSELFGESVTHDSLNEQTRLIEDARSDGKLNVNKSGLIGLAAAVNVPVRKNTFFGSGD